METVTEKVPNNIHNQQECVEEWLSFSLADAHYAIDILRVIEIRVWETVTRIPYAPEHVLGLINLRGAIVPIINLKSRLALPTSKDTSRQSTVVLIVSIRDAGQDKVVGMAVDKISDVLALSQQQVSQPDFDLVIDPSYVHGIADHQDKMVVQLELDKVLSTTLAEHPQTN